MFKPIALFIHYTASGDVSADTVDEWHRKRGFIPRGSNRLKHIGYHALVRKDGTIEEGRGLDAPATHCPGWNNNSLAICMCGNNQPWYPTDAQYNSVADWSRDKLRRFNIPTSMVFFHKDKYPTSCPGNASKPRILSLIDKEPIIEGGEDMPFFEHDRDGGDMGGHVYELNGLVENNQMICVDADRPNHDYKIKIYIKPVVGEIRSRVVSIGGYGNADEVHGGIFIVGDLHQDFDGKAWVTIHTPCAIHGGVV